MKLTEFERHIYELISLKPDDFQELELQQLAIDKAIVILHQAWAEIVNAMIRRSKRMKR